jgi:phage tail-like protein
MGFMTQFTVNQQRFDPYKNFKFRVKWDGKYAAGISRVSALKRTTEVIEHREGGDPSTSRKSPGTTKYEPITLERGVTQDTEFEEWANEVWQLGAGPGAEVSLKDFRKDITIELYNEAGQLVNRLHRSPLLGIRIPSTAGSRFRRWRSGVSTHYLGERRLGTRYEHSGTGRADLQRLKRPVSRNV